MTTVTPRFRRILGAVVVLLGLVALYNYIGHEPAAVASTKDIPVFAEMPEARNSTETGTEESELMRAALVALVRNQELEGMRSTVRQLDDRFNWRYKYPYIFLNDEDFTEEFKEGIRSLTKAPVYFGKLPKEHWGLSPHVTEEQVKDALERNRDRYIYGGSYSYRLMCRFQSGFIHKHPLLQNLDYYWRIEPDVHYFCDIPYDPFRYMRDNGFKYGYTITPLEKLETVETLWDTTRKWMLENPDLLPEKSLAGFVVNDKGQYTRCHFWSNFEIVDLSLYRSEAYESYFQYLDRAGGFFLERWGDAPIHSIAASLFLKKEEVHWFEDIGYHHPGYSHCPKEPEMAARCVCGGGSDYMYRSLCKRRFNIVGDISKSKTLELAQMPDQH